MNLVTSSPHQAAQNYGLDEHIEHDKRYQIADEWAEVVKGLWNTWEPDAVLADEVNHLYADHTKIHTLDFEGEFFKAAARSTCLRDRSASRSSAGGSPAGREFGARHADTIIAAVRGAQEMKEYREDISQRMLANGRKPTDAKVLYLVHPILGDTEQEAQDKYDRMLAAIRANTDAVLAGMSYFTSVDFSQFDLDGPFPDLSKNNGHQSTMNDYKRSGPTLREAIANHRVQESVKLVGTPDSVAAQMEEVMDEAGGDGFLIAKPVTRRNITEIAEALSPALRKRGLIRSSYEWPTFKQNLLAY